MGSRSRAYRGTRSLRPQRKQAMEGSRRVPGAVIRRCGENNPPAGPGDICFAPPSVSLASSNWGPEKNPPFSRYDESCLFQSTSGKRISAHVGAPCDRLATPSRDNMAYPSSLSAFHQRAIPAPISGVILPCKAAARYEVRFAKNSLRSPFRFFFHSFHAQRS